MQLDSLITETPVTPISDTPPHLPAEGVAEGAKVAALMATGYAGLFSLVNLIVQIAEWLQGQGQVEIGMVLLAGTLVWIVGGIPASLIGMVAGRFIGAILQNTRKPLSFIGSFAVGVGIGVGILFIPTFLITRSLLESIANGYGEWVGVTIAGYLPCLFALLGLGWVAHRLNKRRQP
jgi:hypothetical protein